MGTTTRWMAAIGRSRRSALPALAHAATDQAVLERRSSSRTRSSTWTTSSRSSRCSSAGSRSQEEAAGGQGTAAAASAPGPTASSCAPRTRSCELQAARLLRTLDSALVPERRRPRLHRHASCFRRVRPIVEGTLADVVDFRIMPDFAGSTLVAAGRLREPASFAAARAAPGRQVQVAVRPRAAPVRDRADVRRARAADRSSCRTATSACMLHGDSRERPALSTSSPFMNGVTDGSSADHGHRRRQGRRRAHLRAAVPGHDASSRCRASASASRSSYGRQSGHARRLPDRRPADLLLVRRPARARRATACASRRRLYYYWGPFGAARRVRALAEHRRALAQPASTRPTSQSWQIAASLRADRRERVLPGRRCRASRSRRETAAGAPSRSRPASASCTSTTTSSTAASRIRRRSAHEAPGVGASASTGT